MPMMQHGGTSNSTSDEHAVHDPERSMCLVRSGSCEAVQHRHEPEQTCVGGILAGGVTC